MRFTIINKYIFLTLINLIGANIFAFAQDQQLKPLKTVVIDPGHGGKDPGAVYKGIKEKDIVLNIGQKLGQYINKNIPEINVVYTRDKDVFIPLHKRAYIGNQCHADLFISLHANYCGATYVAGTETFVLGNHRSEENLEVAKKENSVILLEDDYSITYEGFDPNSHESYIIFELIQNNFKIQSVQFADLTQNQFAQRVGRKNRGVKEAGFLVLRRTSMPGVLIEVGFLSNPNERQFLASDKGQTYIASAIYRAFKSYKEKIEAQTAYNIPVTQEAETTTPTKSIEPIVKRTYGIQLAASKKNIPLEKSNFKGLSDVQKKKVDNIYKYFIGNFETKEQASLYLKKIRKKFRDAFVISFENGQIQSVP
ncbi:N-acetylmuramoyl-L-alanine amidase [Puteibacter caeruleilacunae]|nr:N-acetylmuramoyl-L-alanine amidase [Puteibacter caeruleilacunae]